MNSIAPQQHAVLVELFFIKSNTLQRIRPCRNRTPSPHPYIVETPHLRSSSAIWFHKAVQHTKLYPAHKLASIHTYICFVLCTYKIYIYIYGGYVHGPNVQFSTLAHCYKVRIARMRNKYATASSADAWARFNIGNAGNHLYRKYKEGRGMCHSCARTDPGNWVIVYTMFVHRLPI